MSKPDAVCRCTRHVREQQAEPQEVQPGFVDPTEFGLDPVHDVSEHWREDDRPVVDGQPDIDATPIETDGTPRG